MSAIDTAPPAYASHAGGHGVCVCVCVCVVIVSFTAGVRVRAGQCFEGLTAATQTTVWHGGLLSLGP